MWIKSLIKPGVLQREWGGWAVPSRSERISKCKLCLWELPLLCPQVLKAIGLQRTGKQDEAYALAQEVAALEPTDDNSLQALTILYREMHRREFVPLPEMFVCVLPEGLCPTVWWEMCKIRISVCERLLRDSELKWCLFSTCKAVVIFIKQKNPHSGFLWTWLCSRS